MPARNSVKLYLENSYYHIYNRGVDKRIIFQDKLDYKIFLTYLCNYLSKRSIFRVEPAIMPIRQTNYYKSIKLVAYCLMPNHFHLLIKQISKMAMPLFMKSIANAYTKYFNERNDRTGHLFQGRYKAILVSEEPYLLHLTRYVHLNPEESGFNPKTYKYSSYQDYLGIKRTTWLHPEEILAFFRTAQKTKMLDLLSYQSFVEDFKTNAKSILDEFTLEE